MLLCVDGLKGPRGERPFRFEKMWLSHPVIRDVVRAGWKRNENTHTDLKELSSNLREWNWKVFGELKGRKRSIFRRLGGIQRKVPRDRNEAMFLQKLEKSLQNDLALFLKQEEVHWYQKLRSE